MRSAVEVPKGARRSDGEFISPQEEIVIQELSGTPGRLASAGQPEEPLAGRILPNVEKRLVYIYDHTTTTIVSGGAALAALCGYDLQEIAAMPAGWWSIVHPDDLEQTQVAAQEVIDGTLESSSRQMRIACKDGHWEWVQHDWRALKRDDQGAMLRAVGLVQVITPMALATQALFNESALNALCRMLVEEWVEGIFLLDSAFRILYANQGALTGVEYSQQELYGRSLDYILIYDTGRRPPRQLPKNGQKLTLRATLARKDRTTYPVEITIRKLSGERILVTSRDISEQQALEEAGRRQTAYYKGLFVNNPSGVAVFDGEFHIKEANPALRKMVGYTDRQLNHMPLAELLDVQSREQMAAWRTIADVSGRASSETEIVLRRRDGRCLYAHAALTMVGEDLESAFRGLIILTDITARRQAEIDLARQSELNDKLVRESAAMIGMVDREGRVLKVNPAVERVSGYTSKELVGKLMWECGLLDSEEIPRAQARMQKLVEGAPRVTALSKTRTKTGELRMIQVQNTAIRAPSGEIESFIITAVDLTEQHRLQHHLMEAVEQEQARIGHDLHDGVGQILTGIGAMTEVLQSRLTGVDHDEAGRIHSLVRQAIQQVRQLSRNMSPAAVQNRDLSASLILLADMVRTSFRRNCECDLDREIRVVDSSMASHLFRIAQEAINNAIRHGNPNRIVLALKRQDAAHAVLEIYNDGSSFDCRPGSGHEGIGLRVMQYRATLIHADLTVTCPSEGGVKVACRFPYLPGKKSPQTKTKRNTP
ncbi:MAG: PAS domain S-box protein [Prosthecobacter sp.]|nr:PAS domain S-box protein [Prosthecobacter sp.]